MDEPKPSAAVARWRLLLVVAGALVVAVLLGRLALEARRELALAGEQADARERIRHLRRAMAHYFPGNPWVRRARDALWAEADRAEAAGRPELALHALRELRSAILALRGALRPFDADRPRLARRIAALATRDAPARRAALERRLAAPPEPHRGWSALGLLGFVGWVGGGFALIWLGLRPDGGRTRRFWPLLGLVLLGLLLFALGLSRA